MAGVWCFGRQNFRAFDEADGKNRLILTVAPALKYPGHPSTLQGSAVSSKASTALLNTGPGRPQDMSEVNMWNVMWRCASDFIPCATFNPTSSQVSPPLPPSILVKAMTGKLSDYTGQPYPESKNRSPTSFCISEFNERSPFLRVIRCLAILQSMHLSLSYHNDARFYAWRRSISLVQVSIGRSYLCSSPVCILHTSPFSPKDLDRWLFWSAPYCGETTNSRPKKITEDQKMLFRVFKVGCCIIRPFFRTILHPKRHFLPEDLMS